MKTLKSAGLAMALFISTIVYAACSAHADSGETTDGQVYEMGFLRMMIDHHGMAAQMAKLCPSRATHQELLQLCSSIVSSQQAEITQMQSWLSSWYQMQKSPEMVEHDQVDMDHLSSLTGAAFETAFMEQMTPHHVVAIQNAAECQVRAAHPELVGMCSQIVTDQASEIQKMRTWLCAWSSICELHFMRSAMTGKAEPMQ